MQLPHVLLQLIPPLEPRIARDARKPSNTRVRHHMCCEVLLVSKGSTADGTCVHRIQVGFLHVPTQPHIEARLVRAAGAFVHRVAAKVRGHL